MLLYPWDFPVKNSGVGCHFLLQVIFLTQGLNPSLLYCRWILYHLSHQGSPVIPYLPNKSLVLKSWTIKKAEHQRIHAFKLWCWRRLLRVLWTARRSNQSILKEISPEYSLEGLMLKLKLQYFGHLM